MVLTNNLARELEIDVPLRSPEIPKESPVHMPAPRKAGVTKLEKLMLIVVGVTAFMLMAICISQEISISSKNRGIQDTTVAISDTKNVNDNLAQEIQELSRYDRVYDIALKADLKMNQNNVRNVTK
ncbi:Cell division protein FtsL [Carnobacterium maltaromaticum]|uniref:cell division protein FtsL n=1 Tax=Carnobacterium maltaromaticum TaxID=2751 RepID=UPI00191BA26B|nr:cell division protein FtsL [Carnobacterium maltaromaticum]CAD5900972.1 Cell division protein FtsL [Carnobacterium maltaromaticum]